MFKSKRQSFHFATLYTSEHQALLAEEAAKQAFLAALTDTKSRFRLTIAAYVVLNDHVHVLYAAPEEHTNTAILNHLRGSFMRIWRQAKMIVDNVPFWGHHVEVRPVIGNLSLRSHLDYIHYDAVWHGLVEQAADYPWSSLPARIAQGHYSQEWSKLGPPASTWRLSRTCTPISQLQHH